MDFRNEPLGRLARILALLSLFIGLGDAARLLGLGAGSASPILTIGTMGFILLSALTLMRLFAAVGLWIQSSWGAIILAASLAIELAFYLLGSNWVSLGLWGFIFKLGVMLATFGLLAIAQLSVRRQLAD
ncbi:hypothetical protein [Pelagibacterium halotolerans]|uniref:Uncharacterized protein n=1 Tax=Pelagibacterium halotolerans (strain DSM 22347 / JCM 15775 / CGMCC 1.7692 / B2) TaxID=1082931 RepID=G4R636_PELHB|nr:hypothetical protein [Pelagibacterium halotolerans]AEQ51151.1 hypothetical protein KKY_1118 [Pelagibacterium halotolerans B2]QJR18977.1 hypothetical protein HKM20_11330 [Pelagibacterium halotolerans]SEA69556.1 hypothetical protein SAMN05428936_106171 [Pelagibacterium halotolerans]